MDQYDIDHNGPPKLLQLPSFNFNVMVCCSETESHCPWMDFTWLFIMACKVLSSLASFVKSVPRVDGGHHVELGSRVEGG